MVFVFLDLINCRVKSREISLKIKHLRMRIGKLNLTFPIIFEWIVCMLLCIPIALGSLLYNIVVMNSLFGWERSEEDHSEEVSRIQAHVRIFLKQTFFPTNNNKIHLSNRFRDGKQSRGETKCARELQDGNQFH